MIISALTLIVGCNKHRDPSPDTTSVDIATEEMWVGAIDDILKYSIPYTIVGDGENSIPEVICSESWIKIYTATDRILTFRVDRNLDNMVREGSITVKIGQSSDMVTIKQRPYADSEFEAHSIEGSDYYGKGEDGLHSYYLVLSTDGLSNGGFFYDDSAYYCFELYAKESIEGRIPTGTYSLEDGSIDKESSCRIVTMYQEATEKGFEQATLNISDGHIEGRITVIVNGKKWVENISYIGSLEIKRNNVLSTLEGSYNFGERDAHIITVPMGDLFEYGGEATMLYIFDELDIESRTYTGDMFQVLLQHNATNAPIDVHYIAGIGDDHFATGYTDDSREPLGSWYMEYDWHMGEMVMLNYAPIKSGYIDISKINEQNFRIVISVIDDNQHIIRGSYNATLVPTN